MIVVAIETATVEVGVAISGPSGLLASFTARPGRRHLETLHPALQAVCAGAGVGLSDVDAVVVDVGPGLFTGIRVGIAAAQGLALGLGVPAVACFSTEVLAHACCHVALDVVPVVDMRRGEVAWSVLWEPGDGHTGGSPDAAGNGGHSAVEPRLGTVDSLAWLLAARGRSALLVGDGARRHGQQIAAAVVAAGGVPPHIGGDMLAAPPVAALAELGALRARAGTFVKLEDLAPLYLRAPDARINWTARAGAPAQNLSGGPGEKGENGEKGEDVAHSLRSPR